MAGDGSEVTVTVTAISACLLGHNCRYDAVVRRNEALAASGERFLAVCPEELGGLPTPRPAVDIVGDDGLR